MSTYGNYNIKMHGTFHSWKTDLKKLFFLVFVTPGHYACPRVFTVTNISYVTYFVIFWFFITANMYCLHFKKFKCMQVVVWSNWSNLYESIIFCPRVTFDHFADITVQFWRSHDSRIRFTLFFMLPYIWPNHVQNKDFLGHKHDTSFCIFLKAMHVIF